MLPLLSPALSHATSTSFNSPSTQIAFNAQSQQAPGQQGGNRSPLEQLQEQQRQFQEQLAVLQQRQLEMQATAAAVVAASSNSPFVGGSNPSSGPSRPATTPGTAMTPTSAGFFSPLTSPALEATNRVQQQHFNRHQFSPAFNAQQARTPHPLSALSSPALNPVGSSGGAQQTLSPALGPQTGADLSDPDYLRALVGMLDGDPQGIGQSAQQANYNSPSMASSSSAGHSTILASPALIPTNPSGTGPHRHSLPAKSRPSPMLKPTNHRSHHQRVPSVTPNGNGHGTFSVPTSPAVQKFHPNPPQPNMVNMGFLPPSAIENRNLAPSTTSMSSASTPSPVDLSHIMPPPPVPSNNTSKTRKGVAPMTPASLMNLGSAPPNLDLHQNQNFMMEDTRLGPNGAIPPPAPAPAKRGASGNAGKTTRKQNVSSSNGAGTGKKGAGNKAVPVGGGTGGGKRTLAIRPQSGAASRAVKPPPPPSEPEHRKTSHKAAEQKRRDSLKAGFDELRLLLPPINVEALDPESGEPIPGSSAPRLLPKSSLVPDDNPNRGVSKVALLRFGNEYIERLKERVDRRDNYIERLRKEVTKLRASASETDTDIQEGLDDEELNLDDDEAEDEEAEDQGDVLDYDWREGEEEEFDPPALTLALPDDILDEDGNAELLDGEGASEGEEGGIDGEEVDENMETAPAQIQKKKNGATNNNNNNKKSKASSFTSASNGNSLTSKSPALKAVASSRRPSLLRGNSSTATVTSKK
nr:uncharacterized protein I303_04026 [Kwoniella dejecticola CBS 10117]OBR86302.1 hypothetical protein I303_04026 [Kwoniella dejecticola CBS 10117]